MAEPNLNVEFSAVTDEKGKFRRLAKLLGLADADHARGKCEHLWLACTRRGETDLPQWLVEEILGERGPAALIDAELARWAGGRGDSKTRRLRISGARKHCTWLTSKAEQSSNAGKSNARTANRVGGKFTRKLTIENHRSDSDPISDPDPEDQISLPACATQPAPAPEPAPPAQSFAAKDLARHRALGDLAEAIWTRLSTLRTQHAAKLGLEGTLPFPRITPGSLPRAFDELRARLREEGDNARTVADHVIRVLDEQARTAKSIEWLSEKAFLERPWSKARETQIGKRKPAAAAPATPPVFMASDDDRAAAAAELAAFLGTQQSAKAAT